MALENVNGAATICLVMTLIVRLNVTLRQALNVTRILNELSRFECIFDNILEKNMFAVSDIFSIYHKKFGFEIENSLKKLFLSSI